jgi:hypothetical protein
MTEYDVKRLALVYSILAEIEAMKAYNRQHKDDEAYTAPQFFEKAEELRILASKHNDML